MADPNSSASAVNWRGKFDLVARMIYLASFNVSSILSKSVSVGILRKTISPSSVIFPLMPHKRPDKESPKPLLPFLTVRKGM